MTVQYQGRPYHLAYYTHYRPWDIGGEDYLVFECDPLDLICSEIYMEVADSTRSARISVSENKLTYQHNTYRYQILPKVN